MATTSWLSAITTVISLGLAPVQTEPVAIVGGTVIDGNGGSPIFDGVVVIDRGRITAIGPQGVAIPPGARRIQATGKYIIPGLMDANVHLVYGFTAEYMLRFGERLEDIITEAAQITLQHGVTTVFDSWGPLEPLKAVRDRINRGDLEASRIFVAGNIVGLDGPLSPDFYAIVEGISKRFVDEVNAMWEQGAGRDLLFMTPDQVRRSIRSYLTKGMDFFKYAVSGHGNLSLGFILFSPDVQRVLIEEARAAGMTVQTHTTTVESVRMAVEAGVDLMQHCGLTMAEPMPETTVRLIAESQIACSFNVNTNRFLKHLLGDNLHRDPTALDEGFPKAMMISDMNQRALIKAGANILLSTDGGVPYRDGQALAAFLPEPYPEMEDDLVVVLGKGHVVWLRAAAEKGLSPMKRLQAATRNIAAAYGKLADLGTLEVGKIADLVILNANPLTDVENYLDIHLVIKDGREVDRGSLPSKRVLSQARAIH